MKPITGRASEHLYLPNGRSLSPFLFTTSIEKIFGLLQYQVIQERIDALRIKTIFEEGCFESGSAILRSILMKMTENTMIISVENCDKIDVADNGKFMVVKNMLHDKQTPYAVN
jgi:hypothetical protein